MKTDILGVAFDALTLDEAEERADTLLRSGAGGYIVTANPEIVLHCREDAAYAAAVNGAAWAISALRAFWERPFPSALRAQTLCRGFFPGSRSAPAACSFTARAPASRKERGRS